LAEVAVSKPTTDALVIAFSGILVFTLLMIIASFPAGIYTVFGSSLSNNYTAASPAGSLAWDVVFFVLQIPVAASLGTLFLGVSLVYLLFLVLAARQGGGFVGAIRSSRTEGFGAFMKNPLSGTLVFLGATSLATVLLDTLQTGAGVPTGSLSGDPFALLIDFSVAPLLEETTFRLIMIGVPVVAVLFIARGSVAAALRCLWRPSAAWHSGGVGDSMRPVAYAFLAISSLLFGYAHYAANSGWDIGKISEAALGGLALGYVYIRYGFHTSVLLHWGIDYVGSVYSFLGQAVQGVPWTSNGSLLDVVPSAEIIFVLGVPSLLIVLNEMLKRIIRPTSEGVGDDSSGQVNPL